MRALKILDTAVLAALLAVPGLAAGAQPNDQAVSPVVGLSVALVHNLAPDADCSNAMCTFAVAPRWGCPGENPCRNLLLFAPDITIVGYSAELPLGDWSRSLALSQAALGPATPRTILPHGRFTLRLDKWSWRINGGRDVLTYTHTNGQNINGEPVDVHDIMQVPAGS